MFSIGVSSNGINGCQVAGETSEAWVIVIVDDGAVLEDGFSLSVDWKTEPQTSDGRKQIERLRRCRFVLETFFHWRLVADVLRVAVTPRSATTACNRPSVCNRRGGDLNIHSKPKEGIFVGFKVILRIVTCNCRW